MAIDSLSSQVHHWRWSSSARLGAALEPSLDCWESQDKTLSVFAAPTSEPLCEGVAGVGQGSTWPPVPAAVGLCGLATAAGSVAWPELRRLFGTGNGSSLDTDGPSAGERFAPSFGWF